MTAEGVLEEVRESLGMELWSLIESEGWTDIMVNDDGSVWIDTDRMRRVDCKVDPNGIDSAAMVLAAWTSSSYNSEESQSLVAVIPIINIRCSFISPPAVTHPVVSFRKPSKNLIYPEALVQGGTITRNQLDFLKESVARHKNILVSGATGCHARGTLVRMADGSVKPVERIGFDDLVMGDDGKPRRILKLHRGQSAMYAMEIVGGQTHVVNEDHVLAVVSTVDGMMRYPTVREFLARPERWKENQRMVIVTDRGRRLCRFQLRRTKSDRFFGFETDGNHLFLLEDGLVVHNSGKTTIMNSLMTLIDPGDRLYVVQDIDELMFEHENLVKVKTNPKHSYAKAIADALRQNPTRVIIGECRYADQAYSMLQAWNTGHPGGLATIHADNARDVLLRLDELCKDDPRTNGISQMAMIKRTIDVTVQMERFGRARKATEVWDARKDELIG